MNYIELIDAFWEKRVVYPLTSYEADFYYYLLKQCNSRKWINPFKLPTQIIERDLNLNRRTICEIRNKLQTNGYIRFIASTRRGEVAEYEIIDITQDPYGNENVTQTEHKPNANRTQNEHKPNTNRTQEDDSKRKEAKENSLSIKEISSDDDKKKVKSVCLSVEERKKIFLDSVSPYIPKYGQKMIDDFCVYWLRLVTDGLMRYEEEEKFSLSGRLATWKKNEMSIDTKVTNISEKEKLYCIDWDKVKKWYVGLGLTMERWTEGRKRAYISIIDSYGGDIGKFKEAIIRFANEVKHSDWIIGLGSSPARDFEWLFTEENFVKVIDGKYRNNRNLITNGTTKFDPRKAAPAPDRTPDDFDEEDD